MRRHLLPDDATFFHLADTCFMAIVKLEERRQSWRWDTPPLFQTMDFVGDFR
ncbi:hypothetical protein BVRB_5g106020 [Beta vulgaris subsp. vulgaris]|nr:hypothetical protein BVRB_5g106020 [Beta vulgaris subsp. vulgaris]